MAGIIFVGPRKSPDTAPVVVPAIALIMTLSEDRITSWLPNARIARLLENQKVVPRVNHCIPVMEPLMTGFVSLAIAPPTPANIPTVPAQNPTLKGGKTSSVSSGEKKPCRLRWTRPCESWEPDGEVMGKIETARQVRRTRACARRKSAGVRIRDTS